MPDDVTLLRRYVQEKSDVAFAELVERHIGLVYGAALRQLNGAVHRAQDVTQTVFVDLARHAARLAQRREVIGWLYTSTHYAAAKLKRAEQRRRNREQEAHTMHEILSDSSAPIDWDRLRPVVDEAMHALSESDREAVLLRFFARRPFAEIGAVLNVSEDGARMRVERSLEKLRVALGRRGITSTTSALTVALGNEVIVAAPAGFAAAVTTHVLAGTGNAVSATVTFMNTPILIVGAVVLTAITGISYHTFQVRRAEAAATAALQERGTVQARLRQAESDVAEAHRQLAQTDQQNVTLQRELQAVRATLPATSAPPKPGVGSGGIVTIGAVAPDGTSQGSRSFIDSPAGRREMMNEAVEKSYAALFRRLGWTEAQREQFKTLMADRKEAGHLMFAAAIARGIKLDKALARKIDDETGVELQARLRATFGDATTEAIRYFESTRSLRHVADELAQALFYTDTPLTHAQADQLVDLMAANARTPQGKIDLAALNSEAWLAQAQSMLLPPQLAVLRQVEVERQKQRELELRALAERNGAPPAKPPGN